MFYLCADCYNLHLGNLAFLYHVKTSNNKVHQVLQTAHNILPLIGYE